MAMGLPLSERDRDSEFRAVVRDPKELQQLVRESSGECLAALQSFDEIDWSAMRATESRGGDAPPQVVAAYALIHATEHLRGHVDQISLMRQLWLARAPP